MKAILILSFLIILVFATKAIIANVRYMNTLGWTPMYIFLYSVSIPLMYLFAIIRVWSWL